MKTVMMKSKSATFEARQIRVDQKTTSRSTSIWERDFPNYLSCLAGEHRTLIEGICKPPQEAIRELSNDPDLPPQSQRKLKDERSLGAVFLAHLQQEEVDRVDVLFDVTRFEQSGRAPSTAVHCDYIDVSAARVLTRAYTSEEAHIHGGIDSGSIVQFWLPTGQGCLNFRLAIMSDISQENSNESEVVVTHRSGDEVKSPDGQIALTANFNAHIELGEDPLFHEYPATLGKMLQFITYSPKSGHSIRRVVNPHAVVLADESPDMPYHQQITEASKFRRTVAFRLASFPGHPGSGHRVVDLTQVTSQDKVINFPLRAWKSDFEMWDATDSRFDSIHKLIRVGSRQYLSNGSWNHDSDLQRGEIILFFGHAGLMAGRVDQIVHPRIFLVPERNISNLRKRCVEDHILEEPFLLQESHESCNIAIGDIVARLASGMNQSQSKSCLSQIAHAIADIVARLASEEPKPARSSWLSQIANAIC